MIRNLGIAAAMITLFLLGARWLLDNSNLTTYAERLLGYDSAPMVHYYAGQGYYNFEDYDTAGRYFKYVMDRYPSSSYTERANVYWLECRTHQLSKLPAEALAQCKAFLERYPKSSYAPRVQTLEEICQRYMAR